MAGRGGALDFIPSFSRNSPMEETVVFGRAASGGTTSVSASGTSRGGRERPRSPSPNFDSLAANSSAGIQDAGRTFAKSLDQQREEEAAKARRLARFFGSDARLKTARPVNITTETEGFIGRDSGGGPGRGLDADHQAKSQMAHNETAVEFPVEIDAPENLTSEAILGICPDMCPEVEREERERKGDLDRFERVEGRRNETSRDLAVKKYTRTAEKDAVLIRPILVLQDTMGYLMSLLERDHENDLLAVHNFLWDRMRAVRMDLRMQHIFTEDSITMHEQMIRFHILAMHELCEYSQGEGISEVFNAHLNIEQMNKASVDLFQMYDDHAKRGTPVVTEAEFRGYYALLKLDKHPGYRVEPAELSLDLAKMSREIRNSPQVFFARDVARACRASNYVAFFRLARKATYLQACLMHAHFAKLRTEALAALHSGLQRNQGIPLSTVVDWLGMEGEDIKALIKYHGFSTKDYEEPYMVKEGPFLKKDEYFPTTRAQLVQSKRASSISMDVQSERTQRSTDFGLERAPVSMSFQFESGEKSSDYLEEVEEDLGSREVVEPEEVPSVEVKMLTEEEKKGKKRHMEELQFEAEEHERRRLRHEADAAARRAASQAMAEEMKRQEEQLIRAGHNAEANVGKQGYWFRKWKRRVAAKALQRYQKLQEAEAALSTISLGPPLWKARVLGESLSLAQRNEYMEALVGEQAFTLKEMWSTLNMSALVGPVLQKLNPTASYLCWKLLLSTSSSPSGKWVRTKVRSKKETLAEESTLLDGSQECTKVDFWYSAEDVDSPSAMMDSKVVIHGASGFLFVTNEDESVPMAHGRLHALVRSVPEGARVPLLILSTNMPNKSNSVEQPSEQDNWERLLKLPEISTSKISTYRVVSITESIGSNFYRKGFFSDKALREGLVWLAKSSPVQQDLRSWHVADLVREHVSAHLEHLLRSPLSEVNPEHCIAVFNQGLQNAAEEIGSTAFAFPSDWYPSAFMYVQEKLRDRGQDLILPRQGWNSKETLEPIFAGLNSCLLPLFPPLDHTSTPRDLNSQKLGLEQALVQFLTLIEGTSPCNSTIKWVASRMIQRGCTVELSESGWKLVPKWVRIFQAIVQGWLSPNLKSLPPVYIGRIHKNPVQLHGYEGIGTSFDLSGDGGLLLDEILAEELHAPVSTKRGFTASSPEIPTYVPKEVCHIMENSSEERESSPQGLVSPVLTQVNNQVSGQMFELAVTQDEVLLDNMLAEVSRNDMRLGEGSGNLVDMVATELSRRDIGVRGGSGNLVDAATVNVEFTQGFSSFQESNHIPGQMFELAVTQDEILLDKMLAELSRREMRLREGSGNLVDMPTVNSRFYLGIEDLRAQYQQLQC